MKKVLEWIDPSGWLTEHRFCWIVTIVVLVGLVWYAMSIFPTTPSCRNLDCRRHTLEWHQMNQYYYDHPGERWCFIGSLKVQDD